jgi:hypothetical protein
MPQYEFSTEQNRILERLSRRMKAVAVFLFVFGGLIGIQALQLTVAGESFLFSAGIAAVYVLMGIWTFKAGKSYEKVVTTEGNDIDHLMDATGSLLSLFNFQFWLFLIAILLVGLGILLTLGGR